MEANEDDLKSRDVINSVISTFKPIYKGLIIYNEGYDKSKGNQILATANADLVSFARPFIACLLYTSPSPRDMRRSRMPSSA